MHPREKHKLMLFAFIWIKNQSLCVKTVISIKEHFCVVVYAHLL